MLGYDLEDERREERPRESRTYDAEDEPVDVEGDSLGWPEAAINVDGNNIILNLNNYYVIFIPLQSQIISILYTFSEKDQRNDGDKIHLSYAEDLEISSTNDTMQSPERVRYFLCTSNVQTWLVIIYVETSE